MATAYPKILLALGISLTVMAIAGLVQTHFASATGGDIIRIHGEGLRLSVNGEPAYFAAGDYVRVTSGLKRLPYYWIRRYAYLTIPLPLALVAFGFFQLRKRKKTNEFGERQPRVTIYYRMDR